MNMKKEIEERISEIVRSAQKKSLVDYDLQRDDALSLSFPGGKMAYFKKRIHELKLQISVDSGFGDLWVTNHCKSDILETGWIQKVAEILLKHMDEKTVYEQIEIFVMQFLQLSNYEKFIKDSIPDPEALKPIIERERLLKIFLQYRKNIEETEDIWIRRFCREKAPINPMKLDPKAKEGSNKLIMLAILATIQDKRKDSFDFNDFVLDRFGIKNFDKLRHDHKDKSEFQKIFKECVKILSE